MVRLGRSASRFHLHARSRVKIVQLELSR
jgi:hypothetical protein